VDDGVQKTRVSRIVNQGKLTNSRDECVVPVGVEEVYPSRTDVGGETWGQKLRGRQREIAQTKSPMSESARREGAFQT